MGTRPAVFLDRDGTLNELVGFINHEDSFRVFAWTAEAVRLVNRSGHLAIVITNQSGIARGLFDEELVHVVHQRLTAHLNEAGAHLDAIYYCPHGTSDGCDCRKPHPGMLWRAERELGVDLSRSYVIGDSYADIEMAWNAGARGVLVLTGYGRGYYEHHRRGWARQPDGVSSNVLGAVMDILYGDIS